MKVEVGQVWRCVASVSWEWSTGRIMSPLSTEWQTVVGFAYSPLGTYMAMMSGKTHMQITANHEPVNPSHWEPLQPYNGFGSIEWARELIDRCVRQPVVEEVGQ